MVCNYTKLFSVYYNSASIQQHSACKSSTCSVPKCDDFEGIFDESLLKMRTFSKNRNYSRKCFNTKLIKVQKSGLKSYQTTSIKYDGKNEKMSKSDCP